ncbi:MAG: helix-turn-helix domain-containing protein [Eubacterium sp.]|nr:helix-turn-helix domain-containing protein [Eubacterium sp.]
MQKYAIPLTEKYVLTVKEAAAYFNIGETKLRRMISENMNADFILLNGTKTLIKRAKFEKMIDEISAI